MLRGCREACGEIGVQARERWGCGGRKEGRMRRDGIGGLCTCVKRWVYGICVSVREGVYSCAICTDRTCHSINGVSRGSKDGALLIEWGCIVY